MARRFAGVAARAHLLPLLLLTEVVAIATGRRLHREISAQDFSPHAAAATLSSLALRGLSGTSGHAIVPVKAPPAAMTATGDWAIGVDTFPSETLPKSWSIDDLQKRRKAGSGSTGVVYTGVLHSGLDVAVKTVVPGSKQEVAMLGQEIGLNKLFGNSTGFVTFYAASAVRDAEPGKPVYIVMEKAAGNLRELVVKQSFRRVNKAQRLRLFLEVARAVNRMHKLGITHRDLRPQNVLLLGDARRPETCSAVLCDYGCACSYTGGRWPSFSSHPGAVQYMPPEAMVPNPKADPSRDAHALGMLLFELFTRRSAASFSPGALEEWARMDQEVAEVSRALLERDVDSRMTVPGAIDRLEKYAQERGIVLEPAPVEEPPPERHWTRLFPRLRVRLTGCFATGQ